MPADWRARPATAPIVGKIDAEGAVERTRPALMATAKNSPHRRITDFQFAPWGNDEERRAWRNERNKRWISSISDEDWKRLDALIDEVTPHYNPAALADLDAPIRIGVAPEKDALRYSGEVFGRMRGCVLMGWPKRRG